MMSRPTNQIVNALKVQVFKFQLIVFTSNTQIACNNYLIFLFFLEGVQCNYWILLGPISGWVQFWSAHSRRPKEKNTKSGFSCQACQELDGSRYSCVQYLCLVDERSQDQVTVCNFCLTILFVLSTTSKVSWYWYYLILNPSNHNQLYSYVYFALFNLVS